MEEMKAFDQIYHRVINLSIAVSGNKFDVLDFMNDLFLSFFKAFIDLFPDRFGQRKQALIPAIKSQTEIKIEFGLINQMKVLIHLNNCR